MKFKNIRSGNTLNVKDEATIELMKGSENYVVIEEKPTKQTKGSKNDKDNTDEAPPAE